MILITGATGAVGSALAAELGSRGDVRGLVRGRAGVRQLQHLGVEPALASFEDDAALDRALDGVEGLFLLSPAGDADMVRAQIRVVDRAVQAGVRRIVKVSSIAADEAPEARIIRAHRAIERHIERSGLAWTHLRPHWFMQNELGQADAVGAGGVFYAPDVTRIGLVDARDVAAAAARVLTSGGHDGRAYVLTGPEVLSYGDLARIYGRVLGREVRWVEVTLDDARASMVESGLPDGLAAGFTEIMTGYRRGGVTARVSPDVAALLGRPPRSFAGFVEDHRDHFPAPRAVAA